MTSDRQIAANRRNALKSTGPSTPAGKRAVRWNALKHGLLAQEVVIAAGDGRENRAQFNTLLARLFDDLQPEGILEEILVEKIAVSYWRLRRVLRCEVGEIRKELDSAVLRSAYELVDRFNRDKKYLALDEHRQNMQRSSLGVQHLIGVLDEVREECEKAGRLTEGARDRLFGIFGTDDDALPTACLFFQYMAEKGPELATEDPEHYGTVASPGECHQGLLKMLDDESERLKYLKQCAEGKEQLETDAMAASLALPSKDAMDRILRYQTTIERELYRAMNQLERMQRQRRGEPMPPAINIDLSGPN